MGSIFCDQDTCPMCEKRELEYARTFPARLRPSRQVDEYRCPGCGHKECRVRPGDKPMPRKALASMSTQPGGRHGSTHPS